MDDNLYGRKRAARTPSAWEKMDTPDQALKVSRIASWSLLGFAAGSVIQLAKWIGFGGLSVFLTYRPAAIDAAEFTTALVVAGLAYFRPAVWSISLVLAVLGLDAAYRAFGHGFRPGVIATVGVEAIFALFATASFKGVRRYAELQGNPRESGPETVFD